MTTHKEQRPRIKISKLQKSMNNLTKADQKKVKGGALADGSVRIVGDGSTKSIKDSTSNT
jgi:hypothetical protein